MSTTKNVFLTAGLLLIVLVIALLFLVQWPADGRPSLLWMWWGLIALLVLFLLLLGKLITGVLFGILIDERRRMSLSRLQLVIWNVIVLSAFGAAAIWNVHTPADTDALKIDVPPQLWILIGIAATSAVASPLVRGSKTGTEPEPGEAAQTLATLATRRGTKSEPDPTRLAAQTQTTLAQTAATQTALAETAANHVVLSRAASDQVSAARATAAQAAAELAKAEQAQADLAKAAQEAAATAASTHAPADLAKAVQAETDHRAAVAQAAAAKVASTQATADLDEAEKADVAQTKAAQSAAAQAAAAQKAGAPVTKQVSRDGLVVTMTHPDLASFRDMFEGEETGNSTEVDIGKVQMFYFTIIVVLAYAMAIGNSFYTLAPNARVSGLPVLAEGIIALLGISHASYVAYKAAPHSKEQTTP
jgi:hypothetical protein